MSSKFNACTTHKYTKWSERECENKPQHGVVKCHPWF